MKLEVQKITPENFADFGVLVAPGDRKPTAELEGMSFWADLASLPDLSKEYGLGYATQAVRPNVQKNAERHMETPELLLSTGGDMVVVVGPADFPDDTGGMTVSAGLGGGHEDARRRGSIGRGTVTHDRCFLGQRRKLWPVCRRGLYTHPGAPVKPTRAGLSFAFADALDESLDPGRLVLASRVWFAYDNRLLYRPGRCF